MELLVTGFLDGVDPNKEIIRDRDTDTYYTCKVRHYLAQTDGGYFMTRDLKKIVISRTMKSKLLRSDFE